MRIIEEEVYNSIFCVSQSLIERINAISSESNPNELCFIASFARM